MIELIASPFTSAFEQFAESITTHCFLASPYITYGTAKGFADTLERRNCIQNIQMTLLTDLSLTHLVQGATDIAALLMLDKRIARLNIYYLARLHAKVYIADESSAVVGSANFTSGGSARNFEYGIRISAPEAVQQIRQDMMAYARLGNIVSHHHLVTLQNHVAELKETLREEQSAINRKIRDARQELERQTHDDLL